MSDDTPDDPRLAYHDDDSDGPPPPPPPAPGSLEARDAFVASLDAEAHKEAKAFIAERERALQQKLSSRWNFPTKPLTLAEKLYPSMKK
jgi:hypothetical protein